jgi:signal transduction histidine kinase/ligand-binding sensor domain-containing protein
LLAATLLMASPWALVAADLRDILTDYAVASWSQKDGLAAGSVLSIAQDHEGYLWVGTQNGLFRFDGVRFTRWEAPPDRTDSQATVRAVLTTRDGSVWAAFDPGRLTRISKGQVRAYAEREGLPAAPIAVLIEDTAGTVWAGGDAGLFRLSGDVWQKWTPARGLPEGPVYSSHLDAQGTLFVGTADGIFERKASAERFDYVGSGQEGQPRSVSTDPAGRVYVTDWLVGFRDIRTPQRSQLATAQGRGRRLLHDRYGDLWVGTLGQGLWRVRQPAGTQRPIIERTTALTGLLSDGIGALLEDRDGNIWVGTSEGLNRLTRRKIRQITNLGLVTGVVSDPSGGVWVSTVEELFRFSESQLDSPTMAMRAAGARLGTAHTDGRNTLWVVDAQRILRHAGGDAALVPVGATAPLRQIDFVTDDNAGGVWLYDLERGLGRWQGGQFRQFSLPPEARGDRIVALFTDLSGRLWIGFASGQIGLVDRDRTFNTYGVSDGFDGGVTRAFHETSDGVIWVAASGGLSKFSNGRFTTLKEINGAPFQNLTAIVDDESHNLWIGSGLGIVRLERDEFEKATARGASPVHYALFDRSDGIAGTPLAAYSRGRPAARSRDGRLWFVTGGGLTVIDPDVLDDLPPASPVRIEQIIADDRRVDTTSFAGLPARTSRLQIDYTVVDLNSPLKTSFKYRLEGFDSTWIDAGKRRQAYYTNLPPRAYRFHVIASHTGGAPQSTVTWDFAIKPTFYQTNWFYAASVGALIVAVLGAWRLRLRYVKREFSVLLQERTRLSREIHDTLLQSLVGLALQFDAIAADAGSSSMRTKEQLVRVRKQLEEHIREARHSIWSLRSRKLERSDLITALREFGEQMTAGTAIAFELTVAGKTARRMLSIEDQLLRIGQEAITNAVRHANATRIHVVVDYGNETLTLEVSDNGCGFDSTQVAVERSGHYGLTGMKERAEQIGGRLAVVTRKGAGTTITLTAPAQPQSGEAVDAVA